jgi:hypothetical protein
MLTACGNVIGAAASCAINDEESRAATAITTAPIGESQSLLPEIAVTE